jgi:hypothetical protein
MAEMVGGRFIQASAVVGASWSSVPRCRRARMRKGVRAFIRRLVPAGLTVKPKPATTASCATTSRFGRRTVCPSCCRSRPTRFGAERRSSSNASSHRRLARSRRVRGRSPRSLRVLSASGENLHGEDSRKNPSNAFPVKRTKAPPTLEGQERAREAGLFLCSADAISERPVAGSRFPERRPTRWVEALVELPRQERDVDGGQQRAAPAQPGVCWSA